jgi:DNA-binding transcriptional LysR family regulator
VLVTVAEQGGFTAAGNVIGLTQSGVSQAVQTLEDALGVKLLVRARERAEATEIGQRVLTEARDALRAVERIHEHCASWSGLNSGTLRIGTVVSAATHLLPNALRLFRTRYPNVRVTLMEGSDEEVRDWTEGGAVDVGLTAEQSVGLDGEIIEQDAFLVVASSRHHRALKANVSVRDIVEQPFIMSGAGCEPAIRAIFAEKKCEPHVLFTVRDMTTLFEMVRQGLGLTIVPELSIPAEKAHLRFLRLDPLHRRRLLVVTRRGQQLAPAPLAFLDMLRAMRQGPRNARSRERTRIKAGF